MSFTPNDPASFDPSMDEYNTLKPFRYWCQKVLPLVYDNSLSYYELLCKVVDYLNKTMEDVETLHGDVDNIAESYTELQNWVNVNYEALVTYVNTYFENLDVQQEINNKLDVMASDGTLTTLIQPYFNEYKSEINGIITNQNTRLNTLEARIDQIATIDPGSITTDADAELVDIRVMFNGATETTAGNSVRTQVEILDKEIRDNLPDGIFELNLSKLTHQLGVISSTAADNATNTIATIAPSTNRMVIGPFQMKDSFVMKCKTGAKYKLYKRFSWSTGNFVDVYTTFQTTTHIEGMNNTFSTYMNYYLMLAYSDDSAITDMADLSTYISITNTKSNPLGLVEGGGFVSGKGVPTSSTGRLFTEPVYYDTSKCDSFIAYAGNSNIRISDAYGTDIFNSAAATAAANGVTNLRANFTNVNMILDYTGGSQTPIYLKDYTSFDDLYDYLKFKQEQLHTDNERLTATQNVDGNRIVASVNYANEFLHGVFANGVLLDDGGNIKYGHVPTVVTKGNYAYVVFQCDRNGTAEFATTTEIDLVKINKSNYSDVTYTVIAKNGFNAGVLFNGRCSNPYAVISGDNIIIYYSGTVNGIQCLCATTYDTTTDTFTTQQCTITEDGNTYALSVDNLDKYVFNKYGIPSYNYEIVCCNPVSDGTNYYMTITSGAGGHKRVPILKSTDLIAWSVYDVLSYENGADCEMPIYYRNSKLYLVARHPYKDCTTRIMKYDISTKKIEEMAQTQSVASRPSIFEISGIPYIGIPMTGRRSIAISTVDENHIRDGRLTYSMYDYRNLGYHSFKYDTGIVYMAVQTNATGLETVGAALKIFFGSKTL